MTETPPALEGTLLAERYLIKKRLGGGGMGAVYLAHDQNTDQSVALKLIAPPKGPTHSPQIIQRMQREIKVLMLAEDPRVIALLDWGKDPIHGLFYTMEMLQDAVDLDTHLKQHRPAFWERLRLFQECLLGLLALHEIKAIHRDIKPQNILCVGDKNQPAIKWIDPGIAKWFPDDLRTQVTVETAPGAMLGTPLYMAPEMWMGSAIDARTDIYQCGIMGFEMLVLRRPFVGNLPQLMHQHLITPMPSLLDFADDLPPGIPLEALQILDRAIQRATQKSPIDRFQELRAFCYALQPVWQYAPASLRPLAPSLPPSDEPRRASLPSEASLDAVAFSAGTPSFAEMGDLPQPVPSGLYGAQTQVSDALEAQQPRFHRPVRFSYLVPLLLGLLLVLFSGLVLWSFVGRIPPTRSSNRFLSPQPAPQKASLPPNPRHLSYPPRPVSSSVLHTAQPQTSSPTTTNQTTTTAISPVKASFRSRPPIKKRKKAAPSLVKKRKKAALSPLEYKPQWNDVAPLP